MATGYAYHPLDASRKEIRLLSIRQKPPGEDQLLECQLRHASFHDDQSTPDYVAISYVWGDSTRRRAIILDGTQISVPENAETALRNLHRTIMTRQLENWQPERSAVSSSTSEVTFWIDSVCINQSDLEERGQQVAIMWRIYSSATMVLIWLGHNDGKITSAMQEIDKVLDDCRKETNNLEYLNDSLWTTRSDGSVSQKFVETDLSFLDWSAIDSLYTLPWFRRLWVIQETCLAKEAYCVSGDCVFPWSTIAVASQWLQHRVYFSGSNRGRLIIGLSNVVTIERYRCYRLKWFELLVRGDSYDTSDPLDKVFGLLGLLQAEDIHTQITREFLPADYSADLRDVYCKITRFYMQRYPDLDVLYWVQQYQGNPDETDTIDIPSWALKLHRSKVNDDGVFVGLSPLHFDPPGPGANNSIQLQLDPTNFYPFTLSLAGCVVDNIKARSNRPMRWDSDDGFRSLIMHNQSFAQAHRCTSNEMFGRLMVLDSRIPHPYGVCSLNEWSSCLQWCRDESLDDEHVGYYIPFLSYSKERCLFATQRGYLGMGPSNIQEGDDVCILFGGRVPYVLHPVDGAVDSWTFLGDAYVDGIMDGEYIQGLQSEDRLDSETRWFNLV